MANKIEIVIGAIDQYSGQLQKASRDLKAFGDGATRIGQDMALAGAAITGALTLIVRQAANLGDEFQKTSIRTGVSVEDLSRLSHAAEIAGADMGALRVSVRRVAASMKDARDGLLEATRNFDELGISVVDTEGNLRPVLDVMLEASDRLKALENTTLAAAIAQRVFGRSGDLLLPLLLQGSDAIREQFAEADRLGKTWDRLAADEAAAFKDALTRIKGAMQGVSREIFEALAPALFEVADAIEGVVPKLADFIQQHRAAVVAVGGLGVALVGGGGLLVALGTMALLLNNIIQLLPAVRAGLVAINTQLTIMRTRLLLVGGVITGVLAGLGLVLDKQLQLKAERANRIQELAQEIAKTKDLAQVSEDLAQKQIALEDAKRRAAATTRQAQTAAPGLGGDISRPSTAPPEIVDRQAEADVNRLKNEIEILKAAMALLRGVTDDLGDTTGDTATQIEDRLGKAIRAATEDVQKFSDTLLVTGESARAGIAPSRLFFDEVERARVAAEKPIEFTVKVPERIALDLEPIDPGPIQQTIELLRALPQLAAASDDELEGLAFRFRDLSDFAQAFVLGVAQAQQAAQQFAQAFLTAIEGLSSAVGDFFAGLVFGTDALAQQRATLRELQLQAQLSDDPNAFSEQIDAANRRLAEMELRTLQVNNAFARLGQNLKQIFASLLSQIIKIIAQLAILKAIFTLIPGLNIFGGLLPVGAKGGLVTPQGIVPPGGVSPRFARVPGFQTGGLVPGIGNSDSVIAALTPGEFVIPKPVVNAIRDEPIQASRVVNVNVYGSVLSTFSQLRELGQQISDVQAFNETGLEP